MSTNIVTRKLASFQLSSDAQQATYVIICTDLLSIVIERTKATYVIICTDLLSIVIERTKATYVIICTDLLSIVI